LNRTAALLEWYGHSRRDLPWRNTTDPWRILVSEVMLQQTQASRVVESYRKFIDRFPDPGSLATAANAEVLSSWMGLGYNTRALRLKEAARIIEERGWPTTSIELRSLPGVGPYTAAAVACFAFGEQTAAIDTNLRRVLSRWVGRPLDGADLISTAGELLADGAAIDWNQAVMDLGATICRPSPDCAACPVTDWCEDPGIYERPQSQGRFEGSIRQARGAILRTLLEEDPVAIDDLRELSPRVDEAVADLVDEGVVMLNEDRVSLKP
jgi:A/G-specific adenine glycosylase